MGAWDWADSGGLFGVGVAEPRIREKGDFVDVEFYRPRFEGGEAEPESIGKVSESVGRVSENEQRILDHLEAQQTITSKTVESLAGVKEARARRILKEMADRGLIEKRGSGRSTHYVRVLD